MSKARVFSTKTTKIGELKLPKEFDEKENVQILAQALRVFEDLKHPGLSRVKTRSEVNISRIKIYKQKHTGRARHGAKSAHIFVGGGVVHGPTGLKRKLSLSRNIRQKALKVALSLKAKADKVVMASGFDKITKTKEAGMFMDKIFAKDTPNYAVVALSSKNLDKKKYFRNIESVNVLAYKDLNAYDVYFGGILVLDESVFDVVKVKTEAKVEVKPVVAKKAAPKAKAVKKTVKKVVKAAKK